MSKYSKGTLAILCASLLLAAAAGPGSARNIELSNQSFRITWAPLRFIAGEGEEICHVTLEGSFHSRTIAKSLESLIGFITRAQVNRCDSPTTTGLGLPWHIRYAGFTGTLPTVTSIRVKLIDVSVRRDSFASCLYRSTAARPVLGSIAIAAGEATTFTPDLTTRLVLFEGGVACVGEFALEGSGQVRQLNTSTRLRVRLI